MTDYNYPGNRVIFKRVFLNPKKHYRTNKVRETINGEVQTYLPYKLEIMNYSGEYTDGFYLVSMDKDNEDINDTWHQTLLDAIKQAEYEFNVQPSDWMDCDDRIRTESIFLHTAEEYLGNNYIVYPDGRYVSKDGLRQVRYGTHETRKDKKHHAHFEFYDAKNGKVNNLGRVMIINEQ